MMPSPDDSVPPRSGAPSDDRVPVAPATDLHARASPAGESPSAASSSTEAASPDGNAPHAPNDATPGAADRRRPDDALPREIGGQAGPEPTRYGDWEKKGRCTDF